MAEINLTGEAPERDYDNIKLKHEARYEGQCTDAKLRSTTEYKSDKETEKAVLYWAVKDGENTYTLSMWMNPKVTKGSGNYSNSKLYDMMVRLGILDKFAEHVGDKKEISNEELREFLKANVIGIKAVIEVSNVNQGKEEEYSTVSKVIEKLESESKSPPEQKPTETQEAPSASSSHDVHQIPKQAQTKCDAHLLMSNSEDSKLEKTFKKVEAT